MGVAMLNLIMRNKGMKRIVLLLVIVVLFAFFIGCEQEPSFSIADLAGTWNFPDQGGYTGITAYVLPDATGADIGWEDGSYSYWCYGGGTYSDGVITGTYDYNCEDSSPADNDGSGSDLALTITFNITNNRLSISCTGTGPLQGKSFTQGVKQP